MQVVQFANCLADARNELQQKYVLIFSKIATLDCVLFISIILLKND